jgi:hypothetical protein
MLLAKKITYINKTFYTYRTNVHFSTTYNRSIHRNDTFSVRSKLKEYMIKNNFFSDNSLKNSFYKKCVDVFSWIYPEVLKQDKADFILKCKEFLPQEYFNEFMAKNKIECLSEQKNQKLYKKTIPDAIVLDNIKNILQDKILSNVQFKHKFWIYDNKAVIIQIQDIKISYDIAPLKDNVIVEVTLKKGCDMDMIYKLYPMFPKNKNYMMIYTTPITTIQTLLVDFMRREIDRVVNQASLIKQVQSA